MTLLLCLTLASIAWADGPQAPPAEAAAAMDVVSAFEKVLQDLIARTEGSVVAIHRDKDASATETLAVRGRPRPRADAFPGGMSPSRPVGSSAISFDFGSGIVIDEEGSILTAFHVVRGASRLIVRGVDRQEFDAEVVAADPRSDLAVIAPVSGPGIQKPRLRPIPLGDAGSLRKGAFLVALGNPFNAAMQDGKANASWGMLSNIARRVAYDPEIWSDKLRPVLQLPHYPVLLQLDSKLNLGMSGGAVLNMKGELVGMTTTAASPSGYDAMAGYAFPIDAIGRRAVETLRQGKEVEYGLLGIRQKPNLNGEHDGPNVITEVTMNSPAALGDLQRDDCILAINGTPVADFPSLMVAVSAYPPGEKLRLKILRNGAEMEKTLVIAKFPVDGEIIATSRPTSWRGIRVDHRSLLIGRPTGVQMIEGAPAGVAVREVEPDSPAAKAGLVAFQMIREVDGRAVDHPDEFARIVADLKGPVRLMTDLGPIIVQP